MKLAEALSLRAELKNKINSLKDRIKESAKLFAAIFRATACSSLSETPR